jgi:hypothetical protein
VFVTELKGHRCRCCIGKVGTGVKEEPSGWKVYSVCLNETSDCGAQRVGTISRSSVTHMDEVSERAEKLVETATVEP